MHLVLLPGLQTLAEMMIHLDPHNCFSGTDYLHYVVPSRGATKSTLSFFRFLVQDTMPTLVGELSAFSLGGTDHEQCQSQASG